MEEKWNKNSNYYDILGIGRDASEVEIKHAFRKLALKWHPDRNNSENATSVFQIIEHAYSILIDPVSRSRYDSVEEVKTYDSLVKEKATLIDIQKLLDQGVEDGFDETEKGFYHIYGKSFEKIALEEGFETFPLFGNASSPWPQVEAFYSFWKGFQTKKDFSYARRNLLDMAPNSNVRRLWNKENDKMEAKAQSEYMSTIFSLIDSVWKLDPRVSAHIEQSLAEKDRNQKELSRIKQEQYQKLIGVIEEFENQKLESYNVDDYEYLKEFENDQQMEWYCDYCNRYMKDERQFVTHCQTKKHRKSSYSTRKLFFEDPSSFEQNSYMYYLLGLNDEEIKKYAEKSVDMSQIKNPNSKSTTFSPPSADNLEQDELSPIEEEDIIVEKRQKWKQLSKKERRKIKLSKKETHQNEQEMTPSTIAPTIDLPNAPVFFNFENIEENEEEDIIVDTNYPGEEIIPDISHEKQPEKPLLTSGKSIFPLYHFVYILLFLLFVVVFVIIFFKYYLV